MKTSHLFLIMLILSGLIFNCTGETKSLNAIPNKVSFGKINIGDTITLDVVLKNKYGKDITILAMQYSGDSDFIIVAGQTTPLVLGNNDEHTITVQFAPSSAGAKNGMIMISHDASTKPKELSITGEGVPVPRINLPVTDYDFLAILINTTKNEDFDIENVGTADMTINSLTLTGAGFSIITGGATPVVVTPGSKHTVTVQFAPIAVSAYQTVLSIDCDAVNITSQPEITIDGEGVIVAPKITLNRTSPWDFGSASSHFPPILDIEMENTGTDDLTVSSVSIVTGTAFSIDSIKDSNGNVINLPQVLGVGVKIFAMIKFEPPANVIYNDKVMIVHDGVNVASPLEIDVTGEGRDPIVVTSSFTGALDTWVVPAGVTLIQVECWGAEGETADGAGGRGGYAKGNLTVTPGETLNIYVGGKNAWNGGGAGSLGGGTSAGPPAPGENGGGASDVRQGGTALTDRKIVAGGGGGGGGNGAGSVYGPGGAGGNGGGLSGSNGIRGNGGTEGHGGTQTAGGAYGTGNSNCGITGQAGVAGQLGHGGKGGNGIQGCGGYTGGGGGGGGGGYYGGGGAGGAAAGAGGAWAGGGGGGGSSYIGGVSNGTTQSGTRSNNGEIVITY
ncbi:MAG: choice-of-anchor D domain-containing protein [Planctomycetes bacterium]|nr:choice-of-anchor D domain-containing protein [Planctomycetota bacterium]